MGLRLSLSCWHLPICQPWLITQFQSCFSLSVCVCVCVCMYRCRPEDNFICCFSGDIHVCPLLWDSLSLGLEFTKKVTLVGQWAQEFAFPPPQNWDFKCTLPHPAFCLASGDWTQISCLHGRHFSEPSFSLPCCAFRYYYSSTVCLVMSLVSVHLDYYKVALRSMIYKGWKIIVHTSRFIPQRIWYCVRMSTNA